MLKGRIYIESFNEDDNFVVDNSYYADENAYIKALEALSIDNSNTFNMTPLNSFKMVENNKKEDRISYLFCDCVLNNEDIDSFIYHNVNSDSFQLEILLNLDECSEDFEYEFKLWKDHTDKMMKLLSHDNDFDVRLEELPNKDLKFSFTNLSGKLSYALLSNCIILSSNNNKLLIRVDKLTFIKCLN